MTETEQTISMDGKEEGAKQNLSRPARGVSPGGTIQTACEKAVLAASAKLLRRNLQA